jgi:arabinogalactan oligomer / maltooligosaccharide transport system permease protein
VVAAFTMVIGIAMSATAGYALSRFNFPGKRGLMWVFLITQMFPVAILIVPIYTIMANAGLIDTKASLVIAYCTVAVPFCAWMLRGYFDTIPRELDEAAALDGLGPFGTFWRVILPLARPGLAVTAFYTFLTAWGEVAYAIAFMQSDDHYTLGAGLQQFVPQFSPRWELLTAGAVLITIPAAIVFFFAQKHLVAGLTAGGTKG